MDDLIKALNILRKYVGNIERPTYCSHEMLHIYDVDPEKVSDEDIKELDELGFYVGDEGFESIRFGS